MDEQKGNENLTPVEQYNNKDFIINSLSIQACRFAFFYINKRNKEWRRIGQRSTHKKKTFLFVYNYFTN